MHKKWKYVILVSILPLAALAGEGPLHGRGKPRPMFPEPHSPVAIHPAAGGTVRGAP